MSTAALIFLMVTAGKTHNAHCSGVHGFLAGIDCHEDQDRHSFRLLANPHIILE